MTTHDRLSETDILKLKVVDCNHLNWNSCKQSHILCMQFVRSPFSLFSLLHRHVTGIMVHFLPLEVAMLLFEYVISQVSIQTWPLDGGMEAEMIRSDFRTWVQSQSESQPWPWIHVLAGCSSPPSRQTWGPPGRGSGSGAVFQAPWGRSQGLFQATDPEMSKSWPKT